MLLLAGTLLAVVYLTSRFYRFSYTGKFFGENKKLKIAEEAITYNDVGIKSRLQFVCKHTLQSAFYPCII